MKLFASIPILFCAAIAFGQTQVADMTGGYGPDSTYNKSFNVKDTFTFDGKIVSKEAVTPIKGMARAVAIKVKQSDGTLYNVHLGPEWFVSKMPIQAKVGDSVIIQGSRSTLNGNKVIYAETISKGKVTIALRSKSGWGRWNQIEPNYAMPAQPAYSGTVSGISTATYGGVTYDVYNVTTTNGGGVSVLGAPSWYSQHQPRAIQIGYNVTVFGSPRVIPVAGNVFIADGFGYGGNYLITNPW